MLCTAAARIYCRFCGIHSLWIRRTHDALLTSCFRTRYFVSPPACNLGCFQADTRSCPSACRGPMHGSEHLHRRLDETRTGSGSSRRVGQLRRVSNRQAKSGSQIHFLLVCRVREELRLHKQCRVPRRNLRNCHWSSWMALALCKTRTDPPPSDGEHRELPRPSIYANLVYRRHGLLAERRPSQATAPATGRLAYTV